jgi:hypothetical protein
MTEPTDRPAVFTAISDVDGDGQDEVVLENGPMRLVLAPADGGRLREWIVRPAPGQAYNLFRADSSDSVEESGGTQLRLALEGHTPEIRPGLGPSAPGGLIDHFLPLTARFRDFAAGTSRDLADLATGAFETDLYAMGDRWELMQQRQSGIRAGKRLAPLTLTKKISLGPEGTDLAIHYRVENRSERPMQVYFAVEWTFALAATANKGHGGAGYYEIDGMREPGAEGFGARGNAPTGTALALVDPQPGLTVRLGWDRAALLWVCPAPAGTHGDLVRGACVMPVWEIRLAPDDNWATGLWAALSPSGPVAPLPPGLAERIARPEWDDEAWKIGGA